jgi:hypothetical protein
VDNLKNRASIAKRSSAFDIASPSALSEYGQFKTFNNQENYETEKVVQGSPDLKNLLSSNHSHQLSPDLVRRSSVREELSNPDEWAEVD